MTTLNQLLKQGLSPAEAVDYYFVEVVGNSQSGWAKKRGINQQAVSQNVARAKTKLELTE